MALSYKMGAMADALDLGAAGSPRQIVGSIRLGLLAMDVMLAFFTGISICMRIIPASAALPPLPVPRESVLLPSVVVEATYGVWYTILLCGSGAAFLSGYVGEGATSRLSPLVTLCAVFLIVASAAAFALCAVYRVVRGAATRSVKRILITISVAGMLTLVLWAWSGLVGDGSSSFVRWVATVGSMGWYAAVVHFVFEASLTTASVEAAVGVLSLIIIGMVNSRLTCDASNLRLPERTAATGTLRSVRRSIFDTNSPIPPFLKREVVGLQRAPGQLVKPILSTVILLTVFALTMSEMSNKIVLFMIYSVPFALSGSVLLGAVGREGNMVMLFRQAGATDRLVDAKAILGVTVITVLSLMVAAVASCVEPLGYGRGRVAAIVSLVPVIAVLSGLLALGIGCAFGRFGVRKIHQSKHVGLGGELLFAVTGGITPIAFYLFADGVLTGRPLWTGTGLVLAAALAVYSVVFYHAGRYRLHNLDE